MKVGFTGTREGMSEVQANEVSDLVCMALHSKELHHGDCIGADAEFHETAILYRAYANRLGHQPRIIVHPPKDERFRAFCESADELRAPKDYIARNHDIVDECDVLIAAPRHDSEEMRSGTWATVRYARKVGKPIRIVYADGEVASESNDATSADAAPSRLPVER
jgi:nucleoside 2-deoxyribosyltransferase